MLTLESVDIDYRTKSGTFAAVRRFSLSVKPGELVTIVGPSGCGKSTLLKSVAGLIPHSGGSISAAASGGLSDNALRAAVVFQEPRLLPWRTALRNVQFPLEQRLPRKEAVTLAANALERVGLESSMDLFPQQLSGGMQQRVNLARALAVDPEVLLLDEPFAALDAQTREHMQRELLQAWERKRTTAMFVTHQVDEAIFLGDRVVVMGGAPGTLKTIFDVPFDRPRSLDIKRTKEFHALEDAIWDALDRFEHRAESTAASAHSS